jgi:exodeoxyribonuclease VIII
LSLEQYHSSPGISSSGLKLIGRSPAHYAQEYLIGPRREPSREMILGSALHALIEGEQAFDRAYIEAPDIDRRYKDGKAAWSEFEEQAAGKTILNAAEMAKVRGMRDAVFNHSRAANLLLEGIRERSIYWIDQASGELVKVRPDLLRPDLDLVADIKSTANAEEEVFQRQVVNLGYDLSASLYLEGAKVRRYLWIVVEREPPHGVMLYYASKDILSRGYFLWRQNLDTYAACRKANHWPGYPTDIVELELPRWAS